MKYRWFKEMPQRKISRKASHRKRLDGYATFAGSRFRVKSFKGAGLDVENVMLQEERSFVRRQGRNDRLRIIFKLWRIEGWPSARIAGVLGIYEEDVLAFVDVIEDFFNTQQKQICPNCHKANILTQSHSVGGYSDI